MYFQIKNFESNLNSIVATSFSASVGEENFLGNSLSKSKLPSYTSWPPMSGIILLPVLETLSKEAIYKENKQASPKLSKVKNLLRCKDSF